MSSEDSFDKCYNFLSPRAENALEKPPFSFESPIPKKELHILKPFKLKENKQKPFIETLKKGRNLEKNTDHNSKKSEKQDLEKQVYYLNELLQKKEKELNKAVFENEAFAKSQEDLKKRLEEHQKREEIILDELCILKKSKSLLEIDKKDLSKALHDAKTIIDKLQKLTKTKEPSEKREIHTEGDETYKPKLSIPKNDMKKFDFQRLRIPEHLETLGSPERIEQNFTERTEETKYKNLCYKAMKIIGVTSTKDLIPKLIKFEKCHTKSKKSTALVGKISNMINQCSPEGTFKKNPTPRDVWRWITRLLEEYMKLKQTTTSETFYHLLDLLDVENIDEIIEKVSFLVKNQSYKS